MADLGLLEYSRVWTNPEDFPSLNYTKNWESQDDFPTIETDETQVRADMQCLFDEIAAYINGDFRDYVVSTGAAEAARVAQENARVANENTRILSENGRVSAETERQTAESERSGNETERVARESIRAANENQRIVNEAARSVFVAWSAETLYVKGNKVSRQGSSYVCVADCTGVEPPDNDHWLLIAAAGATGPQGAQGVQGVQGPRGINGAAVSTAGFVAFNVTEEGHLTVTYADDESMNFSIDNNGHLLVTI